MKIAIVNPSDEIHLGVKGGNQYIAEALAKYINKYTVHKATNIHTVMNHHPNQSLIKSYLAHGAMNLSNFDMVISSKFPSYMIKHHNHICYFAHFYRQFYDFWPQQEKYLQTILTRKLIKFLDKKGLKKTKRIIAYSKFIQKRLRNENIESELIYCPPIEEDFKCRKYDYILSTSILDDNRKRISLLIKAMKFIEEDIKLIIAGTGPHEAKLKKLAKGDSRIIFVGYKSPRELIDYYANALCTCLVSYKEDYGLVTIESMKSKKPVITCKDSGGPLEFVTHNETGLIADSTPESIAQQLSVLIKDKDKAKRLGKNAEEKVREINWKDAINKIIGTKDLAFIHVPRCGGSYTNKYLFKLLSKNKYEILNAGREHKRDWTKKELESFLKPSKQKKYVHNHVENWDYEIFKKYKEKGWLTFSFIRHPGDRLCSIYSMWKIKERKNISLNKFLKVCLTKGHPNGRENAIPEYWKEIDFIAEFNEESLRRFFRKYFYHNYIPQKPSNTSKNEGYDYYCKRGIISKEVQKLIKDSGEYKKYLEIKKNAQ
jgi:glycosyltransferase involved in cell wall biosynthesis